jgi:N-formylglutamate deformylase
VVTVAVVITYVSGRGFRIVPGRPESPVILHVPHGARSLTPAARESIVLDDAAVSAELDHMTDTHTDLIASRAAAGANAAPWAFVNLLSRLAVDPERFPDDREEMREVGMGAVYLRTSHGRTLRDEDSEVSELLLAEHYRPYAAAVTDLVDARLDATGHVVLLDVHSYPTHALPYELHKAGKRPAVCLGTDPFHTPAWLLDAAMDAFSACGDRDVNTPFAGCYVPLEHYEIRAEVMSLMVEIRRDVYMEEPGGAPHDGVGNVVRALSRLIDDVTAHLGERH